MRILHTSDWHLGRTLYGKKRYEEFDRFLQWLLHTIQEQRIDILIIAGDIFDTTAPSNQAQEQYYSFLSKVHTTTCQHIIVIGGNHDSASFLNAPQALLKALNIHVVGAVDTQTEDELIVLKKMVTCRLLFVLCHTLEIRIFASQYQEKVLVIRMRNLFKVFNSTMP